MLSLLPTALFLATAAHAHMQLYNPPPFNAANNPHNTGPADNELHYPYNCCGKKTEYPCRGYLNLLGTPAGAPTATWAAGSQQEWSMVGPAPLGGNHYGGSCQIGFSTDKGKTFRTVVSYEGNCPNRNGGEDPSGQTFNFTVPEDLPTGDVVFAWTWINREQEFNMNCAAVSITGGQGNTSNSNTPSPSSYSTAAVSTLLASTKPTAPVKVAATTPSPSSSPSSSSSSSSSEKATYNLGSGCTCTCDSRAKQGSSYTLSGCDCTCPSRPSWYQRSAPALAHLKHRHGRRFIASDTFDPATQGGLNDGLKKRATAFSLRPEMFIADIGNGCSTPKTSAELKFPDPGPDVEQGDGEYPLELPSGNC